MQAYMLASIVSDLAVLQAAEADKTRPEQEVCDACPSTHSSVRPCACVQVLAVVILTSITF